MECTKWEEKILMSLQDGIIVFGFKDFGFADFFFLSGFGKG